jgi:quercetin dioxygenase-like cupin family protein
VKLFRLDMDRTEVVSIAGATGVSVGGLIELPGDIAVNLLRFATHSRLSSHAAGRPQLFVVVAGDGWVSGDDGTRSAIRTGEAAFWRLGEIHESGSDEGMTCIVVQAPQLDLPSGLETLEHPAILQLLTR